MNRLKRRLKYIATYGTIYVVCMGYLLPELLKDETMNIVKSGNILLVFAAVFVAIIIGLAMEYFSFKQNKNK